MTKLNQIIAVEKGEKTKATQALTAVHRDVQKLPLLSGIARAYRPKDDEGDQLPPESTLVQMTTEDSLAQVTNALSRLFNVTLTKEQTNAVAKADVIVGTETLLKDVPVTYLLFLEKQLNDIHTFIAKLPTLDPSEVWVFDAASNAYATQPTSTTRTKKVPRNHVKAAATERHPAQVEVYYEDVIVGTWTTVKYSGAMPAARVAVLMARVDALINAVKFAREAANNTDVIDGNAAAAVFGYLFAV